MAAKNGHINVLKYLKRHKIIPNELGMMYAVEEGRKDTIQYLESNGFSLKTGYANICAERGNLDLLIWFEEKGILPDSHGANMAGTTRTFGYNKTSCI